MFTQISEIIYTVCKTVFEINIYLYTVDLKKPVTVTAQSKSWTVFARSDPGIVGSNPI
jgi:hypothetical protein